MNKATVKFLSYFIPSSKARKAFRAKYSSQNRRKSREKYDNLALKYGFPECYIHPSTEIVSKENLTMGRNCWIGTDCLIACGGGIKFGHSVAIAGRCSFLPNSHNYHSTETIPYDNGNIYRPIEIEDCVWVGWGSTILGGVKIEKGAIVGAGSVVTKSVPKCAIVAGNPAKIVGYRDEKVFDKLYAEGKFKNLYSIDVNCFYEIAEDKFKPYLEPIGIDKSNVENVMKV